MSNRSAIPSDLERAVKVEAGHRCAIPTCQYPRIEIAHIVPWAEVKEHKFENLIALCPNCHELYDKDKKIDRKAMLIYKRNLGLLNSRYGEFERRVLQLFSEQPQSNQIRLPGLSDILVLYLIKDGFLVKIGGGPPINGSPSWEEYRLTETGRQFVNDWKNVKSLE